MSTYNRFPSGASVEQVKKDAKSLSKSEGIPLHVALNKAAAGHGIALPWAKVLEQLTKVEDAGQFIVFNLTSGDQVIEFGLTAEQPIGVIIGETGTGKSVLATMLCESHLALGTSAVHFVSPDGVTNDPAGRLLHKLVTRHSDRAGITQTERFTDPRLELTVKRNGVRLSGSVARQETCTATPLPIPVVPGDLMVVDEASRAINVPLNEWATNTLALGVGVLLVVQSAQALAHLPRARVSFMLTAESYRQFSLAAQPNLTCGIEIEDAAARSAPV